MFRFIFFLIFISTGNIKLVDSGQCGVTTNGWKIIGGVDVGGYHYPWFALLLLKKNSYIPIPVCAGSLITQNYVLTAAHCFNIKPSTPRKDLYSVALGVYDICNEKEPMREIFDVADVIVHERYQKLGKFYDIALIKLSKPAKFTVVCLPFLGVPDITEVALIIGFGVTSENSNFTPCRMLEVNVTKFSKKDCSGTELPLRDKNEPSVICAGELSGSADSCYGDSGGPLHTKTPDGKYVLAGIVSYGYGCGTPKVPGIYTNVGSYIKWIEDKISRFDSEVAIVNNKTFKPFLSNRTRMGVFKRVHKNVVFPDEKTLTNFSQPKEEKFGISFRSTDKNQMVQTKVTSSSSSSSNRKDKITPKNSKVVFPN